MIIDDPTLGGWLMLRHLAAVLGAVALVLVQLAVGRRVVQRVFIQPADAATRWAVEATIGIGATGVLYLIIAALGLLSPVVVVTTCVAVAVAVRSELGQSVAAVADALRSSLAAGGGRPLRAGMAIAIAAMVLVAVGPPSDWDSLMYHLRVPQQLLDAGRLAVPEDNFHVALVNAAQFSTLPLVAVGSFSGPAIVQVLMATLVLAATFALARRSGLGTDGGWVAVLCVLGSPIVLLVAVTARIDVTLMLALVAAHLVALDARETEDLRTSALLGLLLGIAVATKPQAGAYAVALLPVMTWRRARAARALATTVLVAGCTFLPWAIKNQLLVGAPFYPLGAPGWFQPWLAELYGSRVIPPSIETSVLEVLPGARERFSLWTFFLDPQRLTIETEGRWYAPTVALVLLPLAIARVRVRAAAVAVAGVGVAYFVFATVPFGAINLRYLMPALPALGVGVAVAVEPVLVAWRARGARILPLVAVMVVVFGSIAALTHRLLQPPVLLRHAFGLATAREVFAAHPDGPVRLLLAPAEAVARHVPASGRVLLVNESRGLAFSRPVLADVLLSNWPFVAQSPAAAACLRDTDITHLLVNTRSRQFYRDRGATPRELGDEALTQFRERCVSRIPFANGTAELWELRR